MQSMKILTHHRILPSPSLVVLVVVFVVNRLDVGRFVHRVEQTLAVAVVVGVEEPEEGAARRKRR